MATGENDKYVFFPVKKTAATSECVSRFFAQLLLEFTIVKF